MPLYAGTNKAALLYENQQAFLFGAQVASANVGENIAEGQSSIAFQARRERGNFYPFGVSLEIGFSGDPGSGWEVDIQTADLDEDSHFVTINPVNVASGFALNSNFITRLELPICWFKYIRAQVVTLPNAVATTVLLTR